MKAVFPTVRNRRLGHTVPECVAILTAREVTLERIPDKRDEKGVLRDGVAPYLGPIRERGQEHVLHRARRRFRQTEHGDVVLPYATRARMRGGTGKDGDGSDQGECE